MTGEFVLPFAADTGAEWLRQRPAGARTLLYKHSPACGTSRRAEAEVRRWAAAHPEVMVVKLDVIAQRPQSRQLAGLLHIEHESPQAILLEGERVIWHGSHGRVNAEELESALLGVATREDAT